MYLFRVVIAALVVFILQVTVVHWISVGGASPDLVLVILVLIILERGPVAAVVIGFTLGFLQDLGNASFLGMNALAKSIAAYGVSRIGGDLFPESVLFKGLLIFSASLVNDIISLAVTTSFDFFEILTSFFRYSLLSALYAAVIGMVVLEVQRILTRRMTGARGGY